MTTATNVPLKRQVHDFWSREACETNWATSPKFSQSYFDELEERRYHAYPEILSFAQFTRFHGKRVLEVGIGAGTDFVQWVRAGARAHGIDLTEEAVEHARRRLELEGLRADEIRVADAESLPYPDDAFDLVYSWGVIHHTPNMERAFDEMLRVARPGGRIKLMLYNRRSVAAYYKWFRFALARGRPWLSLSKVIYHHQESVATRAVTKREVRLLVRTRPARVISMRSPLGQNSIAAGRSRFVRGAARGLAVIPVVRNAGWFLMVELEKAGTG